MSAISTRSPLDSLPEDALGELYRCLTDGEIIGTLSQLSKSTHSSVLQILPSILKERYPEQEARVALEALRALRDSSPWTRTTSVSLSYTFSFRDATGDHIQMAKRAAKICQKMLTKHNPGRNNPINFEIGRVDCLNLSITDGEGDRNDGLAVLMMERDAPHRDLEQIIRIAYPTIG